MGRRSEPRDGMRDVKSWVGTRIYTIGHSTRTFEELADALCAAGVAVVADVRTVPRSRRNPQFERATLGPALRARHIRYVHLPELGGLRKPRRHSLNTAWRNDSFRGYADYMLTGEFETGLAKLRALSKRSTVALMCAEAVPWRCHRSLIADVLMARGAEVLHITGAHHASPHRMTPFAHVEGTRVTYPARGGALATRAPFHLEATVRVLQRRPTNLVDVWEDQHYLRVLDLPQGLALVRVVNEGTIDAPDVRFEVVKGETSADVLERAEEILRRVLGLDLDPAPLSRLAEAERALAPTAVALRGMRPPRFEGLFETFANVIPFQQVSLDAGVALVRRLVERFGELLEHDGRRYYAFPRASVIAAARLDAIRRCGLSRKKAEALRHAARAIEAGEVSSEKLLAMSSEDAMRSLMELPGIGPWSAGLVLLRGLRRLDVFPSGDVGVVRGLTTLMQLRSERSLERVIRRFGDLRGYLYFCSLGGALLAKGLIHPAPARPAEAAIDPKRVRGGRG